MRHAHTRKQKSLLDMHEQDTILLKCSMPSSTDNRNITSDMTTAATMLIKQLTVNTERINVLKIRYFMVGVIFHL